jgi:hypothetical protein
MKFDAGWVGGTGVVQAAAPVLVCATTLARL